MFGRCFFREFAACGIYRDEHKELVSKSIARQRHRSELRALIVPRHEPRAIGAADRLRHVPASLMRNDLGVRWNWINSIWLRGSRARQPMAMPWPVAVVRIGGIETGTPVTILCCWRRYDLALCAVQGIGAIAAVANYAAPPQFRAGNEMNRHVVLEHRDVWMGTCLFDQVSAPRGSRAYAMAALPGQMIPVLHFEWSTHG